MTSSAGVPNEYRTSYERMAEAEETIVRTFTVRFILEADGTIGRNDVTGVGDVGLREGLINRVRSRVYEPAAVDGAPVAVYLTTTYTF